VFPARMVVLSSRASSPSDSQLSSGGPGRRRAAFASSCIGVVLMLSVVSALPALATAGLASSILEYSRIELGTLGGDLSDARGINDNGEIVGTSRSEVPQGSPPFPARPFVWKDGAMKDLGTLGGPSANAIGINNKGQVVGTSLIDPGNLQGISHAVLWQDGEIIDLGTLREGETSIANAINDRGQVVGISGYSRAFLWESGRMVELEGMDNAWDINNRGQIVGSGRFNNVIHAALWENGHVTDLGSLGGHSTAVSINEGGQIVGTSSLTEGGDEYPFLWERGVMSALSEGLVGGASAINERGQVVGVELTPEEGRPIGSFVWQRGTLLHLGGLMFGINSRGQIVGGDFLGESFRAYLWTPLASPHPSAASELARPGVAQFDRSAKQSFALPSSGRPILRVLTRPRSSQVEFEITGLSDGNYSARVFDVHGRLVRRWNGFAASGSKGIWDGRRDDGASVVSGAYFLRIEAAGYQLAAKVILSR
jgi:probable HAF family extracellular repeat protein